MIDFLLNNYLEVTISVSLITVLLLSLLHKLDERYTAKWRYWLWLALTVRLLIPLNLSLPQPLVVIQSTISPMISSKKESIQEIIMHTPTDSSQFTTIQLITVLWLVGFFLFIAYYLVTYLIFRKSINRWCVPVEQAEISVLWKELLCVFNIKKSLPLRVCRKVPSPMMTGFFAPVALIPHENYSVKDLQMILTHELVHFKRRDIWYKLALILANAIHWFNPFVYLMAREANRDIEISCDEEVVKNKSLDFMKQYSDTIFMTIQQGRQQGATFSTYFTGKKSDVQKRFNHIFERKLKRSGRVSFLCVACIVVVTGFLVSSSLPVFAQSKLSTEQLNYLQSKYDVHNISPDEQFALRDELLQMNVISFEEAQSMFLAKFAMESYFIMDEQGVLTADANILTRKPRNQNDLLANIENTNLEQQLKVENIQETQGRKATELIDDIVVRQRLIDVLRQIEHVQ